MKRNCRENEEDQLRRIFFFFFLFFSSFYYLFFTFILEERRTGAGIVFDSRLNVGEKSNPLSFSVIEFGSFMLSMTNSDYMYGHLRNTE